MKGSILTETLFFLSFVKVELKQAITLIRHDSLAREDTTCWADLGCGAGLFTHALAHFLQPGSTIYAVDTNREVLSGIAPLSGSIYLEKMQADFIKESLPLHDLDGILLANSLHYVRDKVTFLEKAKR